MESAKSRSQGEIGYPDKLVNNMGNTFNQANKYFLNESHRKVKHNKLELSSAKLRVWVEIELSGVEAQYNWISLRIVLKYSWINLEGVLSLTSVKTTVRWVLLDILA